MTIRDILLSIRRRWYVVVVAMLAAACLFVLFAREGGVYTTKTAVTFMYPSTTSLTPNNGTADTSVIVFARSVAAQVNAGRHPVQYSSGEAPYYGAGIREGVFVAVPNDGNQWYDSYSRAEIDIQIVGPSEAWVRDQQTRYVNDVLQTARTQQASIAPGSLNSITTSVVPLSQSIGKVTATRSAQVQAVGSLMFAALIASAWAAVALDRRLLKRRTRAVSTFPSRRVATTREAAT